MLAWLGPRYLGRSLFIAVAWILLLSILSAFLAFDKDFPLSRSFPLALTLALFGTAATLITLSPFLPNTVRLMTPMVTFITIYLPLFIPNAYWDRIGYYDYLHGLNPMGSAVVVGIVVSLLLILLLVYFPRREYVLSINWVRVLGTGEAVKWATPSEQPSISGIQKWLFSSYDRRVEDTLKSDRLKTARGQIRRWQAGNPTGGWMWWMTMLLGTLGIISISFLLPPPFDVAMRTGGITTITLMAPLIIGFTCAQRKKVFNAELLRPKSRADFQREMRAAFLWNLMPTNLWAMLVLLYVTFSGDIKLSPKDVLSFDAILAPAAILALTASAAALAPHSRDLDLHAALLLDVHQFWILDSALPACSSRRPPNGHRDIGLSQSRRDRRPCLARFLLASNGTGKIISAPTADVFRLSDEMATFE